MQLSAVHVFAFLFIPRHNRQAQSTTNYAAAAAACYRFSTTESGMQSFPSREACCAPGGAFGAEGCSAFVPVVPCWLVAEPQYPNRRCRQSNDVALCNRGGQA